ncbi:hypothetical protein [Paraburkholderia tropica]|uniref:hypothetical protein n=1 Tax=Paraburkholderia tropica TaxID=92647 RepID=UPI002AB6221A|nr:hypothetical protein [Paraburkholderia tropica]
MKKIVVSMLLAMSLGAHAQTVTPDQLRVCGEKAWLFSMAAQFRDSRLTPQAALSSIHQNRPANFDLDDAYVKRSINAVYFNRDFAGVDSETLYQAVASACAHPQPQYQPLQ